MAKLMPPNDTKMTRQHYQWLAWSIREVWALEHNWQLSDMQAHAERWADQCKGTNPRFKRDRFISAVVNGEW